MVFYTKITSLRQTCPKSCLSRIGVVKYVFLLLQDELDEREGQTLRDFDSLFMEIRDGIEMFNLDKPEMFDKDPDHTCLNYFQTGEVSSEKKSEEKEEKRKTSAARLILHLVENNKLSCLSHKKVGIVSEKNLGAEGFKLDVADYFPEEIQSDYMLATESYSTTDGKKRVRVRYIPLTRLSQEDIQLVHDHLSSFQHLYFLTLKKQREQEQAFSFNFLQMLTNSCTLYNR